MDVLPDDTDWLLSNSDEFQDNTDKLRNNSDGLLSAPDYIARQDIIAIRAGNGNNTPNGWEAFKI